MNLTANNSTHTSLRHRDAHIFIHCKGSVEKIACFHWMMGALDPDWPWAPPHLRRPGPKAGACKKCGGMLYQSPLILPQEVKVLARQINDSSSLPGNLSIKTQGWKLGCGTTGEEEVPEEVGTEALVIIPSPGAVSVIQLTDASDEEAYAGYEAWVTGQCAD